MKTEILLEIGEPLFGFVSLYDYADNQRDLFAKVHKEKGITRNEVLCIDANGHVCMTDFDFHRAWVEKAYPIIAYDYAHDVVNRKKVNDRLRITGDRFYIKGDQYSRLVETNKIEAVEDVKIY